MKQSSEQWSKEIEDFCTILDPDGWDRHPERFYDSWNEIITKKEFINRLTYSTICSYDLEKFIKWSKEDR